MGFHLPVHFLGIRPLALGPMEGHLQPFQHKALLQPVDLAHTDTQDRGQLGIGGSVGLTFAGIAPEQNQRIQDHLGSVLPFGYQGFQVRSLFGRQGHNVFLHSQTSWADYEENVRHLLRYYKIDMTLGCMLTSDYSKLILAIRPIRAVHHLREARILNVTNRSFDEYASAVRSKFGTEIIPVSLDRVVNKYHSIDDRTVAEETARWMNQAVRVVEPSKDEISRSCRMALALEQLLHEEQATVVTVDCYGTMYEPLCRKYAYPCIGFTRLNDMGFGGICESDLQSAMTHILFQGLSGNPGFVNDPTVDESIDSIILAHCLGTTKMDGPDGPAAPYQLRTIMERREGAVPQVRMRLRQPVTSAIIAGTDTLRYFTGTIIDVPET